MVKGIEDYLELLHHDRFFKELRMDNRVLIIQHHTNARVNFLQPSNFRNVRRNALFVSPKVQMELNEKDL